MSRVAAALASLTSRGAGLLRRRWQRICTTIAMAPLPGPRRLSPEDSETLAWFRHLKDTRDDHTQAW